MMNLPTAQLIKTQADIAFCIDATGSMEPCFQGLKNGIQTFVQALQSHARVDYRLRFLAYRDVHSDPGTPWEDMEFTSDVGQFVSRLSSVCPQGGADNEESTLDALYRVVKHSPWRSHKTHCSVVLFTDDDTHAALHPLTYAGPEPDARRVIQLMQQQAHFQLFMVVPRFPTYELISRTTLSAGRQVVANYVPYDASHKGLANVDFGSLLRMIGRIVSQTSLVVQQGS